MPIAHAQIQVWLARRPVLVAIGLSMGTSLGISLARFSYALFVPTMRDDLGWSYLVLGAMNTAQALGYLLGALTLPLIIRRFSSWVSFVLGGILTSVFLGLCALVSDAAPIAILRFLSGFTSASVFAGGTVLIAQLASLHPGRSGLLLGIYYAGGGLGMVITAFLVPATIDLGTHWQWRHPWQMGWLVVGLAGLFLTLLMWKPSVSVPAAPPRTSQGDATAVGRYAAVAAAYFCFGMGYIGYMTFVISLLRELGWDKHNLTLFYAAMGLFGMFSAQLWAKALDRFKGGECLAIVNALLALACLIPACFAFEPGAGTGHVGMARHLPFRDDFWRLLCDGGRLNHSLHQTQYAADTVGGGDHGVHQHLRSRTGVWAGPDWFDLRLEQRLGCGFHALRADAAAGRRPGLAAKTTRSPPPSLTSRSARRSRPGTAFAAS